MVAKPNGSAEPVNKVLLEFNDVELCIDELQYLSVISHLETLRMRYRREMVNNTVFSKYYETKCIVDSILNSDPLKVAPQVKIPYYGLNLPVILWCSGTIFLFTHGKRSANCALSDIKRKTEDRKLKNIIKRLKNQEEYMKLYLMHRQGVATEESSKAMNNLERSLPYESIVLYRSMVISFMERDAPKSARKDQQAGWSIRGAISSLWWGYGSEDQNQPQLPEDDTMEALFDTVGYDPNAEDAAQYTIRGAMLEVEFKLKTLIVDLRHLSEEDTSLRKNFATLRIENLNTCIYSSSGGISGSFVIGNVVLKNKQKSGTIFPILIGSNSEKASQLERNENPFFRIMFRDTVVDGTKKSSVSLEVLPLNIVIDIKTIQGFTDFFVAHLGNTDTLAIKNDAKDKIMGLTHNTKVAIMSALKDRKMIDLKLDFYAPVLIIPEDIDNPKLSGIVIDLGRFILETDTVKNAQAITRLNEGIHVNNPKSSSATESKKSTQESPPDDAKRLDEALINAIYEDFKCTISDVDVAIVELGQLLNTSGDIKLSELRKGDLCTYQPAIKCSTINVSMGWRIIDSITYLPKIEICVEIPSLDFQISDYHLGRAYSVVSITSELLNINKTPITTEKKCVRRSSTIRELISDTSLPTMDSTLEVDGDLFYEASENPHDSGTGVRTIFSGSAPEYPKIISNVSIHIDSISANIIQSSMSSDGEKMEFRDIFHAKLKNFSISSRDFDNIFEAVLGINDVYLLDLESTNVISGNRGSDQERQVIEITHKQAKSGFDVGTPHIDSSLDVFMGNFSINISDGNIIRMRSFFNSLTGCIKNDSAEVMPNNNSTETNSAMSSPWSKINFRMKHVYISVTYLDEQIATFILGSFLISAILLDDSFKAECVVGSITISNDNPKRSLESVDVCKNLFETIGSEVARFSIVGKNSDGSSDMNNRILSIKLSMRSASIIYEKDAFSSLYAFYENCISTNYLHDTAKQVAINSAHRMKADSSELRLEASIRSIAVVIPSLSQKHSYGVVALMDNVKFSNKFITDTSNLRFNHITANVGNSSISLSHFESIDLRASLIDVIALSPFNVDIDIPVDSSSSHVNVILAISHIKLKPDPVCMEQLMNIYDTVIRTSNGTSSESHAGTTECTNLQNIYSDARGELPRDSASSYLPLVKNDYDINLSCDEVCLTLSVSPENHDTLHFTSLQVIFTRLESQLVQCGNNVSITADIGGIELRNEISVNKPLWSNILVSNCDTHSSIEVKYEYNGGDESQTRVDIISPKVFIDPESVHTLVSLLKSNCNFVKFNDMLWKNEQAKHPSHKIDNHIIFNLEHLSAYVVQDARQTNVDMLFLEIDNFSVDYTKEFNISIRDAFISTGFGGLDGQNVLLHFKNECVAINSLSVVSENSLDFTTANSTISKVAACFSHNDLLFFSDVFKRFRLSKSEGDEEGAPIKEDSEFLIPKTEINNVCRKYSCHINDFIITFIGDAAEPNIQKYLVDISDARLSVEICNDISANIDAELSAYFFNLHNFSWEPVMEKCAWTIDSCYTSGEEDISNKKVSVVLETRSVDIDISHVFIKNILETLDKIRESTELTKLAKRSSAAHYALYNHTGIDMMIFGKGLIPEESESPNSSGSSRKLGISPGSDIRMLEVAPNSHIKFSLPIWRPDSGEHKPAADSLSIYFEGLPVETLRGVSLDATRPMVYTLKPAIDNVRHKVLCNARIEGNTKHFDFFSGMSIKNAAKFEINIYVFITKPPISLPQIRDMEKLLRPGGTFNVPIIISYYGSFYFQPLIPNTSNQRTLMFKNWKELSSNTSVVEICSISDADNSRATYFSLTIVKKKMEGSVYAYPFMDILIRPPFTIENLLPYDIIYELFDDRHHRLVGGSVTAGSGDDIYSISSRKPIRIFVSVLAPVSLRSKEGIVIKIAAENGDIKKIPVYDTNDNALYLFVHCVDGSIKIYCPYVILNKTGLPLQYRTVHITSKPEFLAGQVLYPQSSATEYKYSDPFLYSSKNFEEIKSKLELRIPGSEWGGTIGVEIVGTPNIISLPIGNSDKTTKLSVWVSGNASKCSQTKFIHIEPYVYLKNTCGRTLILAHGTGKATITIKDSETLPLLQFYGNEKNHYLLSVNFECGGYCFSSFLSVINLGPVHLKIPRSDKSGFEILIVEVSLVGFSIHVVFASVEEKCPYLFENTTNINFYVNQDGCKSIYKIPSNGKLPFSWDEPTSSSKLIVISTGIKVLMKTDLFKMGNLGIFKLNTSPNTSKEIAVVSEDRKSYISVTIAEKRKAFSTLLSPKDSHANTGSQELAPYTSPQCTQTTSGTLFNLMLLVSRIGISVINKSVREIIYIYGEDLYIGYTIGPKGKYYEFGLGWLQIDDQSSVVPDQILLYPTSTIKDESGKRARFLSMSASGCADLMYGVNYFKDVNFLMQEISITLDEALLIDFMEFSELFSSQEDGEIR